MQYIHAVSQWDDIFQRDGRIFLEPAPLVVNFAATLKSDGYIKVLDIGCGSGRHVVHLAKIGLNIFGLDNSPAGLRLTSEWLKNEALQSPLILADAHQPLPFPGGAFDAVISTQVIHHATLATVQETAQEIARIVRPGGRILISVPGKKHDEEEFTEIEPGTFVPLSGSEKGLPHHIFKLEELPELFTPFETQELSMRGDVVMVYQGQKKT